MKDCKFCDKKGLLILLLRYAVVVGEAGLEDLLDLPATLVAGVRDLKLTHGKYAPRLLREGYVYMLVVRRGIKSWEGYAVTEDGFLYRFPVDTPPISKVEFSCDTSSCGIDASCVAIDKVDEVSQVYFLFTPSALTVAKLAEYKANAESYAAKGKMQVFDPKAWVRSGSRGQEHSLKPELIGRHVPEWQLYKQAAAAADSPLGKTLKQQLFPALSAAYAGLPPPAPDQPAPGRLGLLLDKLKRLEGAAFVLHDPIGITQELNDFRNAALEPIDAFLATTDKRQVSNQRKLEVSQAIEDVKSGFEKALISDDKAWLDRMRGQSEQRLQQMIEQARLLRLQGRTSDAQAIEQEVARSRTVRDRNYAQLLEQAKIDAPKRWNAKYAPRLDQDEIGAFKTALKTFSDRGFALTNARSADHITWVTSSRLVNAFDAYDPNHLGKGFEFALQHAVCTNGMVGSKDGANLVAQWLNVGKVERTNLYQRAYLFNSTYLQEKANETLAEVQALVGPSGDVSNVSAAAWLKASKGLIDGFKKADSAWDEWLRDGRVRNVQLGTPAADTQPIHRTLSKFHRSAEGFIYKPFSEMTQAVARSGLGGKLDKGITVLASAMLYSRIGDLAEKLAFDELMLKVPSEKLAEGYKKRSAERNLKLTQAAVADKAAKVAGQVDDSIEVLIKDAQQRAREKVRLTLEQLDKGERPPTNNYHQARLGAVLMSIEAIALANKLQHFDRSMKAWAESVASVMSLISIVLDMGYAVAKSIREIKPFIGIPSINKASDIVRGGLKLTAGSLATAAGTIGAVIDFSAMTDEIKKQNTNPVLVSVYLARAAVGGTNAVLGLIAAYSYSGPMLRHMVIGSGSLAARFADFLTRRAVAAESLAAVRTLWLIRVARFNLIGLGITGVEIIYRLFFMDDTLQDWCDASTFRKEKGTGLFKATPFADAQAELEALYKASAETR